jgi:pimeloyl-ACP methyl ester carboxylesterase
VGTLSTGEIDPADELPIALLGPGAGSTPELVGRLFAGPLERLGYRVASWRWPAGWREPDELVAVLADQVARERPALVGGVSLGAHVAAAWAAATGWDGRLLLVMPAWTGKPDAAAAASAATADELEARGVAATLARIRATAQPWVAAELARAWSTYAADELVDALRSAARAPAPEADALRRITAPAAVVGLAGDPLHPYAVAERWAQLIPRARLVGTPLPASAEPALGAAAANALRDLAEPNAVSASRRSPGRARAG